MCAKFDAAPDEGRRGMEVAAVAADDDDAAANLFNANENRCSAVCWSSSSLEKAVAARPLTCSEAEAALDVEEESGGCVGFRRLSKLPMPKRTDMVGMRGEAFDELLLPWSAVLAPVVDWEVAGRATKTSRALIKRSIIWPMRVLMSEESNEEEEDEEEEDESPEVGGGLVVVEDVLWWDAREDRKRLAVVSWASWLERKSVEPDEEEGTMREWTRMGAWAEPRRADRLFWSVVVLVVVLLLETEEVGGNALEEAVLVAERGDREWPVTVEL